MLGCMVPDNRAQSSVLCSESVIRQAFFFGTIFHLPRPPGHSARQRMQDTARAPAKVVFYFLRTIGTAIGHSR